MSKRRRTSKSNKKAKRRLIIFGPISIIIIGYFLISSTNYIVNTISLNQERNDLKHELEILKENEGDLKNEIEKLKDPDYIARFARENYLYSKNGEYIIKIENKNDNKKTSNNEINSKYITYVTSGVVVFAVIIIIWIIRKK